MKVNIYSKEGKKTSAKVDMDNRVFKIDPNEHCIYLAVKSELAAKRQGTSSSKTRSEVSGGGRKPYKQRVLEMQGLVRQEILQECMEVLHLDLNQENMNLN